MALSFGVTVLPDPPYTRFLELIELAEQQGFEYGWTYDSPLLWQEASPLLTMAIERTERMKFGHFVTNPGTREPTVLAALYATLHDISGGRMVMGIGRGDSARRVIGQQPVKMAEVERAIRMVKDLMNGRKVDWNDKELELTWARTDPQIPMYVAAYGPKALGVAGRVGAKHGEFVSDEICDRFCVIGTAEQCADKLRQLEQVGVDQFNLYLMTHGQDEILRAYGSDVIPQFAGVKSQGR
jgi:alkanesulfonate monooxygenase SsuD/methylene tetrahydromethanopterin reductase-like flavin-dependent oxidoreductase (luciferase family)